MFDSILAKLTVKPLLIAIGVLLLALAVLTALYTSRGATLAAQAETIRAQEATITTARDTILAAEAANQAAMATIADLNTRLADAIGQNQRVEEANAAARAALAKAQRDRNRYLAELNRLKEATYATDPDCAEWGARPVCPAISDQLRDQWTRSSLGGGEAGSGGGPGAAVRGAGPGSPGSGAAPGRAGPGMVLSLILEPEPPVLLEPAAGRDADGSP